MSAVRARMRREARLVEKAARPGPAANPGPGRAVQRAHMRSMRDWTVRQRAQRFLGRTDLSHRSTGVLLGHAHRLVADRAKRGES